MATEGDKLHTLINRMAEIEAEQPAEEVVVEMTPEEQGRLELQRAVSHAYKIMDGVDHDSFQTDAEEILFEQIVKDLAELEVRIQGDDPIEPNEDISQKEQDSAESYLQYIDELTKELAHDKNSEHFHKDIAHQIQNAVDDLRNNVIGTKPSQARAKFSDQSGKL